jgi:hypothetical protein
MSKIHENLVNTIIWTAAFLLPSSVMAQAGDYLQISEPEFSGPLIVSDESYPQLAAHRTQAFLDLDSMGYVEEEYLVSGQANVYDWALDGSVSVKISAAPYTTRILVRRPADPAASVAMSLSKPLIMPGSMTGLLSGHSLMSIL